MTSILIALVSLVLAIGAVSNPGAASHAGAASAKSAAARQCFGAAARDPEAPCSNPKLRLTVVPKPSAAFKSPNWPCTLTDSNAVIPVCVFGATGAAGTVALIGDSHAAHWRAAVDYLAGVKHWRGLSLMRPGCPFSTALERLREQLRRECVAWHRALPRWFQQHPNVSTVFTVAESGADWVVPRGSSASATARNGFVQAFRRLPPTVKRLVVIRDSPKARTSTAACIERAIARGQPAGRSCAVRRRAALVSDPASAAALQMHSRRVQTIDLTHFFCDAQRCYPVVGGALVYKDDHHLTTVFVRTLGPYLLRSFDRLPVPPGA